MKIIFSRKGFDSVAGGFPSLIFPDGTLFSIPIPVNHSGYFYPQLPFIYNGDPIQQILNDVTGQRINHGLRKSCNYSINEVHCHYDPQPFGSPNNRFVLGVGDSHLHNQGVSNGDIFLFYGWYKHVEKAAGGHWQYIKNSPDIHLIWGWMKVADFFHLNSPNQHMQVLDRYSFLTSHPHLASNWYGNNWIYLSDNKNWKLLDYSKPHRCLTDLNLSSNPRYKRSQWRLPACFNQVQAFSFLKNFTLSGSDVIINYTGFGQEFVLNLDKVPTADSQKIISYLNSYII